MSYPHHSIPDGHALAPHHLYLGLFAALVVAWMVSDDQPHREAWVVVLSSLAALFAFALTWRFYPVVGATLTLTGLLVALFATVVRPFWWSVPTGHRAAAVVGLLVALDDAVEHALGIPTPLDQFWRGWLYPVVVRAIEGGA